MTLGQKMKDFFGFSEEEEFENESRPIPPQTTPIVTGKHVNWLLGLH